MAQLGTNPDHHGRRPQSSRILHRAVSTNTGCWSEPSFCKGTDVTMAVTDVLVRHLRDALVQYRTGDLRAIERTVVLAFGTTLFGEPSCICQYSSVRLRHRSINTRSQRWWQSSSYHPGVLINGEDATIGPWHDHIVIGDVLNAQHNTIFASDTDNGSADQSSATVKDKV